MSRDPNKPTDRMKKIEKNVRLKQQEERLKQVEEIKKLRELFNITFGTPEGMKVLRTIRAICGHNTSPKVVTDGKLQVESTIHNIAQQDVYLQIRALISPRILVKIELQPGE